MAGVQASAKHMDIATILGLAITVSAVVTSFWMEGGSPGTVLLVAPMILVIGGAFGVAVVGGSFNTALRLPVYLKIAIRGRRFDSVATIDRIVYVAEMSRREGVLKLEKELGPYDEPLFLKAMHLVIDGVGAITLQEILETEIHCITLRHQRGIDFFNRVGGFSPTLGILGTVLALVHTLSSVTEPDRMAASIASAFIATLWGVGMANMVYLPIADKLKMRHEEEVAHLELITEGVLAIQSGETPRVIRRRLQAFLPPSSRDME